MAEVRPLDLPGVFEIIPKRHRDDRGFFSEVWSQQRFAELGLDYHWVQDNHSRSNARGVLRGLHYQLAPAVQVRLVRATRGSIFDVAVDLRRGSATFGKWVGLVLSADRWNQVLIPAGFAHGFVTLEPDTEVQYKVNAPYCAELDRAIRYDDPDIGIDWPVDAASIQLSDKDRSAPALAEAVGIGAAKP